MGEINYRREKCWQIPDRIGQETVDGPRGWTSNYWMIGEPPQASVKGSRLCFPEMEVSHGDYTTLGYIIDLEGRQQFLDGRVGGKYDYETGEGEYWFRSPEDARGHLEVLVEKGFLRCPGIEAVNRPAI
jgi:hypothetical protein